MPAPQLLPTVLRPGHLVALCHISAAAIPSGTSGFPVMQWLTRSPCAHFIPLNVPELAPSIVAHLEGGSFVLQRVYCKSMQTVLIYLAVHEHFETCQHPHSAESPAFIMAFKQWDILTFSLETQCEGHAGCIYIKQVDPLMSSRQTDKPFQRQAAKIVFSMCCTQLRKAFLEVFWSTLCISKNRHVHLIEIGICRFMSILMGLMNLNLHIS